MTKQIRFIDIFMSSILTFILISLTYYFAERLSLVPIFNLHYESENQITPLGTFSILESLIFMIICLEIGWISAQLFYWRIIRKFEVIW